jgi:hypothetical protein
MGFFPFDRERDMSATTHRILSAQGVEKNGSVKVVLVILNDLVTM